MQIVPIYQSIAQHAAAHPDKPAIVVAGRDRTLSYAGLRDRVAAAAVGMARAGIEAGHLVAIASDRPDDHLIAACAAMAIGAVPVPLPENYPQARDQVLAGANPRLVVTFDGGLAGSRRLVDLEEAGQDGAASERLDRPAGAEDLAMIYFTSGTTSGEPKGVMQPHRELEITARNIVDLMRLTGEIVELVATPTETGFWFGRCRFVLRVGGTLVLNEGALTPMRVLTALEKHGCNGITGDSPIFVMLVKMMEKRFAAVGPQMRWTKVASQSLAPEIKSRMADLMPNCRVVMNYGLMEAMRVSILPFHEHPDKLASVGKPCPGVSVRIVDKADRPLPPDEVGEIQISGANVAVGYYNRPDLWRQRFRDNWYSTGDIGFLDADGFLYVKGRKDEAMNVGGKIVSPFEVETAVRPFLSRTGFQICGADDPDGILGEVPVLCVDKAWNEEVSWPDLKARLQREIPGVFVPRLAVLVPEFPMTGNGKLRRMALRQQVESRKFQTL